MNLEALGAELPLELTDDGHPALRCPAHPSTLMAIVGDALEPCFWGCSSDDVLAYYAKQSPILKRWLKGGETNDRGRNEEVSGVDGPLLSSDVASPAASPIAGGRSQGGDADESRSERVDHINAGPLEGATDSKGPSQPGGEFNSQGQNNGRGSGGQQLDRNPQLPLRDTALEPVFRRIPPQNIEMEQGLLGSVLLDNSIMPDVARVITASLFYRESHREIYKAMTRLFQRRTEVDALTLCDELRRHDVLEAVGGARYVAELAACVPTAKHYAGYAEIVIEKALRRDRISQSIEYLEALYNGSPWNELQAIGEKLALPALGGNQAVMTMNQEQSVVLNDQYLARPEIIERLGYAQTIMLIIGGKHHGKTTNIRTLALSECRALPIWGRKTAGGPVLYMASDDELAPTRNELLSMGWSKSDPLRLGQVNPETEADPVKILADIAADSLRMRAVMIILDMLFDFAAIRDELSYAQTRQAIGRIQWLADETKALVVCSHHTPKYLTDAHNAANAALGSQGISARFSPIVLTRKWTDNLFTVESTATRDPRGQALEAVKVKKNEAGWIETVGEFKEWMKWEIYADKVMAIFEGGDPKEGQTVAGVAKKLEIDRARAQNTLYQLSESGKLKREKFGHSFKYYLASTSLFDREGGNWSQN